MKYYILKVINNMDKKVSVEVERFGRDLSEALTDMMIDSSDMSMFNSRICGFIEDPHVQAVAVEKDDYMYTWVIEYKENGYSYNTVIHAVPRNEGESMLENINNNLRLNKLDLIIGMPELNILRNGK